MAKSKKPRAAKLQQTVDVEVSRVPFVPFEAARRLDVDKLVRASRAVVELGQFESECCKRTVRAVVKKGYVTEVRIDPCEDGKPGKLPRELDKLLARADAKLSSSRSKPVKLPIAVTDFFGARGFIDIDIPATWTCYTICVGFFGYVACFVCCVTTIHDGSKIYECKRNG